MSDEESKVLIEKAYNLHVSGNYSEAKLLYEQALTINPNNCDLLNLYAQVNVSLKNYDVAIVFFKKVYEKTKLDSIKKNIANLYSLKKDYDSALEIYKSFNEKTPEISRNLALIYLKTNKLNDSLNEYISLYNTGFADYNDKFNLSLVYFYLNDYENALKISNVCKKENPDDIDMSIHIAAIYEKTEQKDNELKYLLEAAEKKPSIPVYYRIAVLFGKLNNDDKSIEYINKILNLDSTNKDALTLLAYTYKKYDKNISADIFKKLSEIYPDNEDILVNLYIIYDSMMDNANALAVVKKLLNLNKENSFYNLLSGDTFFKIYDYDSAEVAYKNAVRYDNTNIEAKIGLSNIYYYTNRYSDGCEVLIPILDNKTARNKYTYLNLKEKMLDKVKENYYEMYTNFDTNECNDMAKKLFYRYNIKEKYNISEQVFSSFEKISKKSVYEKYMQKKWKNQDIKGKKLLIFSANGAGDVIMFSRYIYNIKNLAAKIILQVPNTLFELIKENFPFAEVVSSDKIVDENDYDYAVSFMLLPVPLNISLEEIQNSSKYMDALLQNQDNSINSLFKTVNKKVGLFWQGNPSILQNRSIQTDELEPLFNLNNLQLYSFQLTKFSFDEDFFKTHKNIIDLSGCITSYYDTAKLLKNIDILITIDSSIAHLAGAMGINTYLLLPYGSDWRWFHDEQKTPWYDSINIYKQTIPGNWKTVVERIADELRV